MKKKVLVVDDSAVVLKFMTRLLSSRGHHVVTAQDGLSALDILKKFSPDVLFIDLIMPNIDGEKLCRIVRNIDDYGSNQRVDWRVRLSRSAPHPDGRTFPAIRPDQNHPDLDRYQAVLRRSTPARLMPQGIVCGSGTN